MFCQVRQVLTLALRRWGFQVCAVKNEEDAINKLTLRGKKTELHRLSHMLIWQILISAFALSVFQQVSVLFSGCLSVCPSVCLCVCLSVCVSVLESDNTQTACQVVCQTVCPPIHLYV